MRKLFLLVGFFSIAPVFLLSTVFVFFFLSYKKNTPYLSSSAITPAQTVAFAALPTRQYFFADDVIGRDIRIEILREYFSKHRSPLEEYTEYVVETADFYGLDYRLIPAIAMQESNLCKKIPSNSYNCWGFGIYGNKVKRFESYTEAIDTVTRTLARDYKSAGLESPEEIMRRYTPANTNNWAGNVALFMEKLQ